MVGGNTSLLILVEQRIKLKRELEESQKGKNKKPAANPVLIPHLQKDCIFNILVRLPIESVPVSRFVCKLWYEVVNSPHFINSHLQRSETGLMYLAPATKALPSSNIGSSNVKLGFSVESKASELLSMPVHDWHLFNPLMSSRIKFVEIKDGKGTIKEFNATCAGAIRATCNGLVVLKIEMKKGGLVVLNPVTREMDVIPLGTMSGYESYGLAFCHESRKYKLVHLFQDAFKYYDCEIMDIGSGSWRGVDGPPNGLLDTLHHEPVFAIGALHWVPRHDNDYEYIVSMTLKEERFVKVPLPETGRTDDRILEMGGCLSFVTRQSLDCVDVWMLRSLGGDGWEKKVSISLNSMRSMVPLCFMKGGEELVFRCEYNELHVYDLGLQILRKIEVDKECLFSRCSYFPHVNSLISWK